MKNLVIPPSSTEALPDAAEVVIIGGGVMGLSTAYHLARAGVTNIVVLERSYLCSGASGRNGGGVRMQWSTEDNIVLMRESVELCKRFAQEMGFNVWFRQGGYLFLAKTDRAAQALEQNAKLQNGCGVPTRILNPEQASELVEGLVVDQVIAASYNPDDGVLFPWPFLWGYAARALDLGVKVFTFCEVSGFERTQAEISAVHTSRGTIRARHVINATGAWSPAIGRMVGLELPNQPFRHEILTTEPLKPFLTPMVTVLGEGIYFSQSMRGEIVGGMGDPDEPSSFDIGSSLDFTRRFARSATALLPALANVQVVRQWAGLYDASPDGKPILGESRRCPNLTHLAGFTGHGFMMAPIIGKLCAERLAHGHKVAYFDDHSPDRFAAGVIENRETMIIG